MGLNTREKALLSLPLILGGVMGFYNWVHEPLMTRRAEAAESLDKVRADIKRDESKLKREGDLASRLALVSAKEQTIDSWVPGKNSAAMMIWHLSQAEYQSGARIMGIQLTDRRTMQSIPAGQKPGAASADQQRPPARENAKSDEESSSQAAPAGATLDVITLNLQVDARFAEHLLFNQALEQIPLFLSTEGLSLVRAEELGADELNGLMKAGQFDLAARMLRSSPKLTGAYQVSLYFKGAKAGPPTNSMSFDRESGRMDPFASASAEDFVELLRRYFRDGKGTDGQSDGYGDGRHPLEKETHYGQLG